MSRLQKIICSPSPHSPFSAIFLNYTYYGTLQTESILMISLYVTIRHAFSCHARAIEMNIHTYIARKIIPLTQSGNKNMPPSRYLKM